MTAQILFHRHFTPIYISLMALLGVSGGWLTAVIIGGWLATTPAPVAPAREQLRAVNERRPLNDYEIILARNLFDARSRGLGFTREQADAQAAAAAAAAASDAPPQPRLDLVLIGTVVAGEDSLALIRESRETKIYRLNAEVPGGARIEEISRSMVILRNRDGSRQSLALPEPGSAAPAAAARPAARPAAVAAEEATTEAAARFNIREVGENKWQIPRATADEARGNLNELLRQARMEPRIIAGETQGFIVRMIRPNTFLDMLGLQRGDVVMEINNIKLDSPEKALQIFQQLREARNINIGLIRNDQPITFEYEIN